VDLRKLKTIIELFETSQVSEMEIQEGEDKIRLLKHGAGVSTHAFQPLAVPLPPHEIAPAAVQQAPAPEQQHAPSAAPEPEPEPDGETITSPMVGTFYRAPSPEEELYARVGDKVQKGQVIFIIEAMKLMNEITAPCDGVLAEVFPENGSPVAYGDKLAVIR